MAHPPELRQRAKRMRREGMLLSTIAADLGVPAATVLRWTNPALEARERKRARKNKFSKKRRCPSCGRKMSDNATRCQRCYRTRKRYWTREKTIEAIRAWALKHGHQPASKDWERGGRDHPAISSILGGPDPPFRKWSEALVAAGFTPRKRRRPRLNPEQRAALRRTTREDKLKKALENHADM